MICYLLHPLGSVFPKHEFSAVLSPVSVADKAKRDDIDPGQTLTTNCDILEFLDFPLKKKYLLRAHLATAAAACS